MQTCKVNTQHEAVPNLPLFEADVVINVQQFPRLKVDEHVIQVSIPESDDVTDHAHDGQGPTVLLLFCPPFTWGSARDLNIQSIKGLLRTTLGVTISSQLLVLGR